MKYKRSIKGKRCSLCKKKKRIWFKKWTVQKEQKNVPEKNIGEVKRKKGSKIGPGGA